MSYFRQPRHRNNGFGIVITGYGGDSHYDRLGYDMFNAEAIRMDNFKLLEADLTTADPTVVEPILDGGESLLTEKEQINILEATLRAEAEANSILGPTGELKYPMDPTQNPALYTEQVVMPAAEPPMLPYAPVLPGGPALQPPGAFLPPAQSIQQSIMAPPMAALTHLPGVLTQAPPAGPSGPSVPGGLAPALDVPLAPPPPGKVQLPYQPPQEESSMLVPAIAVGLLALFLLK